MKKNCFSNKIVFFLFPELFFSRNVVNSIKCKKNIIPLPPTHPHIWDKKNQNKGIDDYIGYRFPLSLSTIWRNHFPLNQSVREGALFNISIFFQCWKEHKTRNEMRNKCFSKKKNLDPPPPPEIFFTPKLFFLNVGNSIKREENMKYWKTKFLEFYFFQYLKNSNIPSISKTIQHTPMTWCMYVPAKFRENTSMCFRVPVRKLNVTDGQTDRGHCNISRPGPLAHREILTSTWLEDMT